MSSSDRKFEHLFHMADTLKDFKGGIHSSLAESPESWNSSKPRYFQNVKSYLLIYFLFISSLHFINVDKDMKIAEIVK